MRTSKFVMWLFVVVLFALPASAAQADTGPKPTMTFIFTQAFTGQTVHVTEGVQYECDQADCSDAALLKELGPQRFTCDGLGCHSLSYGYSTYHRIEVQFSDGKTRVSNVFQTAGFDSTYRVRVRLNDLQVEPELNLANISPAWYIAICCASLLGLVGVIAIVVLLVARRIAQAKTA